MNAFKSLGLLNLIAALGLFFYGFKTNIDFAGQPKHVKFQKLWEQDFQVLKETRSLPEAFDRVGRTELEVFHPDLKDKITSPIPLAPDGEYVLKILILPWEADGHDGAMIQYDLYEAESNAWVWEKGRSFYL